MIMAKENIKLKRWKQFFIQRIDQFLYIKIQPTTIHLSIRLWGITAEFVGFIPYSLVLSSIVLC